MSNELQREIREVRAILKFLRSAPINKHGGLKKWCAKIDAYESTLAQLRDLARAEAR